jgi:hypothetical protein
MIPRPAKAFVDGAIEMFRHGLAGLSFDGIELPSLTICVEPGGVSFDYCKGNEWNERTVGALFSFLAAIKRIAPNAVMSQDEEGYAEGPSEAFRNALKAYAAKNAETYSQGDGQQAGFPPFHVRFHREDLLCVDSFALCKLAHGVSTLGLCWAQVGYSSSRWS